MAEYSEDMCDPGDIPECQILNLEMSTSETELSSCLHDPHPPNRAVIFMKHSSDQDENANDEAEDSCDEDGLPVIDSEKFNRNYFTMTYTDNEATEEFNNNAAEEVDTSLLLDTSLSGDEEEEEEEEEDPHNVTIIPGTSAKKSLMKLFSPEKLPLRQFQLETQQQQQLSPMDVSVSSVSSPAPAPSHAFSLSEDSLTCIVGCRPAHSAEAGSRPGAEAEAEADSLDEISSGEMSEDSAVSGGRASAASQNISEFWDDVSGCVYNPV